MCYTDDARPPLPPVGGAATDQGDMHLTASDGNRFMAYFARAAEPSGAGIVVMPDVRGLHFFYKELAQRFAEAGVDAVAIDYFGRTAGDGPRDESFEYRPHVDRTTPEGISADVGAAVEYLRSAEGGGVRSVFTVGFCFGGAQSWRQSAAGHGLGGAIGFYGVPSRVRDVIPAMRDPLLMLIAGQDFTPQEEFQRFDGELSEAGVPHKMVVYETAPHSFFDRTFKEHEQAAADSWRQMLDFMKQNTAAA
ncbi:MAG: dienelactone hydrolase [Candidatus Nephthysia bennettiae]|uniref:Dienelactone hydrolase family protein n=1 Tax=Candidatus Nephthysia bennettiae TaxID=3127016 RepID=A0A934NFN1_9BACT|nr:dienelactone hydrolase family protein [Candidatus Dormibacteraeota bacterium]MBJ7612545.1 dienelactone hydrolase family protein [Candidatus Dormibacteraeota bacterium]PZR87533.1 MAG: dienelactone hydrolase [Candidatus Dormibacteraeota bacterium]